VCQQNDDNIMIHTTISSQQSADTREYCESELYNISSNKASFQTTVKCLATTQSKGSK